MGPGVEAWLQRRRYKRVFFLEPLDAYAQTRVRMESEGRGVENAFVIQTPFDLKHGTP